MWDGTEIGAEAQETAEQSLFDRLTVETAGMFTCNEVRRHVERHFQLEPSELLTRSRKWRISHPRQFAMALCYKHFRHRLSYQGVARQFGEYHLSTVIHACQKMGMEPDPAFSKNGRRARLFRMDAQIARRFTGDSQPCA
jgi:chromosomal replication initiation ATPase DnaA